MGTIVSIGVCNSLPDYGAPWAWSNYSDTSLTATPASDTAIDLAWTNPVIAGVTLKNVVVEISTDGVTFTTSATLGVVTSTQVTGLTAGTLYYFRLVFVSSRGVRTGNGGVVYSKTVPLSIYDGNTSAWFDYEALTTITKDGSNLVSRWNDKLGSGHDLIQATESKQPLFQSSGVLFDGISNFMKTATFPLEQPTFIYAVLKQKTFASSDYLFDGFTNASGALYQTGTSPNINAYAGAAMGSNDLSLDTFAIVRILFNGEESRFAINDKYSEKFNGGVLDMNGFTLGSYASGSSCGNIEVKEIIIRKVVDNAEDHRDIYNYLSAKFKIGEEYKIFDNGKFLFCMDAEQDNLHTLALPVLITEDIKSTMYVQPNVIGSAGFMTWDQIKDFADNKCDLQDHPQGIHTSMTPAQIATQYDEISAAMEAKLYRRPYHTAYMGGQYNEASIAVVQTKRKSGRSVISGTEGPERNIYTLKSTNIGKSAGGDIFSLEMIKGMILTAKLTKTAFPVHCHKCAEDESTDGISPAHLAEVIQYAKTVGVDIITISELYDLLDDATVVPEMALVTGLTLTQITGGVQIDWDVYSEDADGLEVWKSIDNGTTYSKFADLSSDIISTTDTSLATVTAYYTIRAKRGAFDFSKWCTPEHITLGIGVLGEATYWWDFSDATKVTVTGSGISSIASKGTITDSLTQTTDAKRPPWTDGNCADFNGTTHVLLGTLTSLSQPHTILIDTKRDASEVSGYPLIWATGSYKIILTSNLWSINNGTSLQAPNSDGGGGYRRPVVTISNGANSSIYYNGSLIKAGDSGAGAFGGVSRLGAHQYDNNYYYAKVYEVLVFNRALTPAEILWYKKYVDTK